MDRVPGVPPVTVSSQFGATTEATAEIWRSQARERAAHAFRNTPVFVYTMGKVGSTTVYDALSASDMADCVFQVHSFNPERLAEARQRRARYNMGASLNIIESEALLEQMRSRPEHPIKLITLVRDPIAREISAMFETRWLAQHVLDEHGNFLVEKTVNYQIAQLTGPESCQSFFTWFDWQVRDVFGIDILETPFPKERGWQVYRNGAVEMLLIRLEDFSRIGPATIAEFLEMSGPIEYPASRVRREESYPLVRDRVKLPVEVCERLFRSPLMTHLYDEAAIDGMISRWCLADEQADDAQDYVRDAELEDLKLYRTWAAKTVEEINADRANRLEANQQLQVKCGRRGQQNEQLRRQNKQLRQQVEYLCRRLKETRERNEKRQAQTALPTPSARKILVGLRDRFAKSPS